MTTPILRIDNLTALLSSIVCKEGIPHTALIVAHSGAVITSQGIASSYPFPSPSLSDRTGEERARMYAAVATTTWDEGKMMNGTTTSSSSEPLLLETEVCTLRC